MKRPVGISESAPTYSLEDPATKSSPPFNHRSIYICHGPCVDSAGPAVQEQPVFTIWFIAGTVPPTVEEELKEAMMSNATESNPAPYQYPPKYPADLTLSARIELEGDGYELIHLRILDSG